MNNLEVGMQGRPVGTREWYLQQAAQAVLQRMPLQPEFGRDGEECCVCLEAFLPGLAPDSDDCKVQLPCSASHCPGLVHMRCMQERVQKMASNFHKCPLCIKPFLPDLHKGARVRILTPPKAPQQRRPNEAGAGKGGGGNSNSNSKAGGGAGGGGDGGDGDNDGGDDEGATPWECFRAWLHGQRGLVVDEFEGHGEVPLVRVRLDRPLSEEVGLSLQVIDVGENNLVVLSEDADRDEAVPLAHVQPGPAMMMTMASRPSSRQQQQQQQRQNRGQQQQQQGGVRGGGGPRGHLTRHPMTPSSGPGTRPHHHHQHHQQRNHQEGPVGRLKACCQCLRELPSESFSQKQLKRKGRARCRICVAEDLEAEEAAASASAAPPPPSQNKQHQLQPSAAAAPDAGPLHKQKQKHHAPTPPPRSSTTASSARSGSSPSSSGIPRSIAALVEGQDNDALVIARCARALLYFECPQAAVVAARCSLDLAGGPDEASTAATAGVGLARNVVAAACVDSLGPQHLEAARLAKEALPPEPRRAKSAAQEVVECSQAAKTAIQRHIQEWAFLKGRSDVTPSTIDQLLKYNICAMDMEKEALALLRWARQEIEAVEERERRSAAEIHQARSISAAEARGREEGHRLEVQRWRVRELDQALQEGGWIETDRSRGGHRKFFRHVIEISDEDDGSDPGLGDVVKQVLTMSSTPSDSRSMQNSLSELRRKDAGVREILPPDLDLSRGKMHARLQRAHELRKRFLAESRATQEQMELEIKQMEDDMTYAEVSRFKQDAS